MRRQEEAAFNRGVDSAKKIIGSGTSINLRDEGRCMLSSNEDELHEAMGWNSQVFSEDNKKLMSVKG